MRGEVFADWLDVTCSPGDFETMRQVTTEVLQAADFRPTNEGEWRCDRGNVQMHGKVRWGRVSASGQALAHLRAQGLFMRFLAALSGVPHRVTRLDAAMDTPEDGADVIQRYRERYRSGFVKLSHKPVRSSWLLANREDGRETGTFFIGHRKRVEVAAAVYDKAWERLTKAGESHDPWTRYEVRVRSGVGPTLRDAAEPERLFWHYASPALLDRPDGVPVWEPGWGEGWSYEPPPVDHAALLRYRVETSPELASLIELADKLGAEGRTYLSRLLTRRVHPCGPTEVH